MQKLKKTTLLFDLGGVIINLNTSLTIKAFAALGQCSEEVILAAYEKAEFFKEYEKGEISDDEFRKSLRGLLDNPELSDQELDEAWNSMIRDLPRERLEFLLQLRKDFNVLLLSNTNDIHLKCVNERVKSSSGEYSLDPFFDKCYYSMHLKLRKPEPVIYQKVLQLHNANPEDVLFLDDNIENLRGAETIGIKTIEIKDPGMIFNVRDYV